MRYKLKTGSLSLLPGSWGAAAYKSGCIHLSAVRYQLSMLLTRRRDPAETLPASSARSLHFRAFERTLLSNN